jgi:hypothetical protein
VSQPATFEPDDFVTANARIVPVSGEPGGPPYRFDTGDPDPSKHPVMGFSKGMGLVVLHGPVIVDAVEWYLLTPAQLAIDVPTGWSPLTTPEGTRLLAPIDFECPRSPMNTAQLAPMTLTDGLPACYGHAEVTIGGRLTCTAEPDSFVEGASWLEGGHCKFDEFAPTVYGLDPTLAPGRYRVTGHFDDAEASTCRQPDGDSSKDRLQAVLHCRRGLVATSAVAVPE